MTSSMRSCRDEFIPTESPWLLLFAESTDLVPAQRCLTRPAKSVCNPQLGPPVWRDFPASRNMRHAVSAAETAGKSMSVSATLSTNAI